VARQIAVDPALAARWQRIVGYVVDVVVLLLLNGRLVLPALDVTAASRAGVGVVGFVVLVYDAGCHSRFGKTFGKFLLGTAVVAVGPRTRPTVWQAVRRWFLPTGVLIVVLLVSPTVPGGWGWAWRAAIYLPVAFTPRRQGLHDFVGATVVVRFARMQLPTASVAQRGKLARRNAPIGGISP
jgi:uncharacterized RDD family membrane protein YckC